MTNQTFSYTKGQQLRSSIKQTLPNLLKLKREENKIKFNKLLLELVPDMEKIYCQKNENCNTTRALSEEQIQSR